MKQIYIKLPKEVESIVMEDIIFINKRDDENE